MAEEDHPQSNLESPRLDHAAPNLVAEALYVEHRVLICIASELSQKLVRL
jgi:hypothetical protein